MPALSQTILLALNASLFVSLSGVLSTKSFVLASPLPLPFPLMAADYSGNHVSSLVTKQNMLDARSASLPRGVLPVRPLSSGSLNKRKYDILRLEQYADSIHHSSDNLRSLASRAPDHANDHGYQRDCVQELSQYQSAMSNYQTVLGSLAADKGLANYDKSDPLETLIKDVINCHKVTLDAVDELLVSIPGLGPLFGPTLYAIKCILDSILDACENIADRILTAFLQALINGTTTTMCRSDPRVMLDLCVTL